MEELDVIWGNRERERERERPNTSRESDSIPLLGHNTKKPRILTNPREMLAADYRVSLLAASLEVVPDRPFHNFRALKSIKRCLITTYSFLSPDFEALNCEMFGQVGTASIHLPDKQASGCNIWRTKNGRHSVWYNALGGIEKVEGGTTTSTSTCQGALVRESSPRLTSQGWLLNVIAVSRRPKCIIFFLSFHFLLLYTSGIDEDIVFASRAPSDSKSVFLAWPVVNEYMVMNENELCLLSLAI